MAGDVSDDDDLKKLWTVPEVLTFDPSRLERELNSASPAVPLSTLATYIAHGQLKIFSASVRGNGMHGGNRVVFDVRFSIEAK